MSFAETGQQYYSLNYEVITDIESRIISGRLAPKLWYQSQGKVLCQGN